MKKILCIILLAVLLTGCKSTGGRNLVNNGNKVQEVLESQVNQQTKESKAETKSETPTTQAATTQAETASKKQEETQAPTSYDLTVMGADMVYATVFNLIADTDKYIGSTYKIQGRFYSSVDDSSGNRYFFVLIKDAMGCCSNGLEFVWGDGSHKFPDEYPPDGTRVTVTGVLEKYQDRGTDYYHLARATFVKS